MFKQKIGKLSENRCRMNLICRFILARKDEDGKVIVGPRNFTTKPMKKGKFGK